MNERHGMSGTRIYSIWKDMKHRCDCPNLKNYKFYGGRGIKYSPEWKKFMNFYFWAIDNGYDDTLTLDRIDFDGDYEPNNCRWVNKSVQNANRHNTGSTEYIGVHLISNKSSYKTAIKNNGNIIFSYSSKSKNDCAKKRNDYIMLNNLPIPLNEIHEEYEDVRTNKRNTAYIATNIQTGETIQCRLLKQLADTVGLTRQFISDCLRGQRNSSKYIFERINVNDNN